MEGKQKNARREERSRSRVAVFFGYEVSNNAECHFLTEKFYRRYKDCPEIEQKTSRPYIRVGVLIDGVLWAIPMRSNINHEHTIWTDKANKCGIDFTKAVVIDNPAEYISSIKPHIRPNEFEVLKSINSYTIEQKMRQYIKKYKKRSST